MQLRSLKDSVAVVTGASSGIGEAAARALADEGVNVVLAARSKEHIEALARDLGGAALAVPTDVSDPGQVARLFARVQAEFGGLDLLFNNAGVGYHGRFETSDPAEWERMIGANLSGVLHCTHQAIGLMRNREGAMISSVASVLGRHGMEGWSVYTATKYAVVGFHEALRKELGGEGIRVSLIEPGAVYTAWGHNVPPERMKERRDKLEALQAEDIARTLVFGFAQPANVNVQELLVMPTRQTTP